MHPKTLWLTCILTASASAAFAAPPGKMKIELVDPPSASASEIPTITGRPEPKATAKSTPTPERGPGEVLIRVENADLSMDVLPLFEEQVGVRIRYLGAARKVTLRLTRPLDWEEALKLVARFSNTHPSRDRLGALVLQPQWGEAPKGEDDLDGQVVLAHQRRRPVQATTVATSAPRTPSKIEIVVLGGGPSWIDTTQRSNGPASVGGQRAGTFAAGLRAQPPRQALQTAPDFTPRNTVVRPVAPPRVQPVQAAGSAAPRFTQTAPPIGGQVQRAQPQPAQNPPIPRPNLQPRF